MPAPMCSRANSRTGHLFWIAAFTMTRLGSAPAQTTQSAGTLPSFASSYKAAFLQMRYMNFTFVEVCVQ